jgi:hypothetical protein
MMIKQTLRRSLVMTATLAAFSLTGVFTAAADTSHWSDITKHKRSDDVLALDALYCDQRVGEQPNGSPTTPAYKKCMLSRGWRFNYEATNNTGSYINDHGLLCHGTGAFAICGSEPSLGTLHYERHGLSCTRTGLLEVCS